MENCQYQGRTICTFDLKDESGLYYEDRVLDWKQAAADRLLTCEECGAHVYLAAGPIKEPYFAHYDVTDCDYGSGHETEELKKGKRMLYQLLKRSFPDCNVRARYRLENGMYSTLFCENSERGAIALDYRLQNNSLEKYRLRDSFYQEKHIKPIYVMGIRQVKDTVQVDWYQNLLQTSMGYLAFLDVKTEQMLLKKSFGYRLDKERRFRYCIQSYPIKDLLLDFEGQMLCGFFASCSDLENQIREEKHSYQIKQDKLRRLQEENRRSLEEEDQRLAEYRRRREEAELRPYNSMNTNTTGDERILPQDRITEDKQLNHSELNPVILEKCRRMIEEGNAHLVSRKYYEAIINNYKGEEDNNGNR